MVSNVVNLLLKNIFFLCDCLFLEAREGFKFSCLDRQLSAIYYPCMIIIKSSNEIQGIKDASKILAETFEYIKDIIKEGMTTKELDSKIDHFIKSNNAFPAFKGYRGFPASSCISINEVVIHGIPGEQRIKEGDLVGIDIGVQYQGFFSDAAYTFGIGNLTKEDNKLIETTKKALYNAIGQIKKNNRVGDISHVIQKTAENSGFNVVRDFVGHGVGKKLHEDPPVPNFGKSGIGPRLKNGMILAVEPMINAGSYEVTLSNDGWTVKTRDGKHSAHFEHTILVADEQAEVLTQSSLYENV
jgi:methionyl aminopeptidase